MKVTATMPRLKGFRFPREVIDYAVWAFHSFVPSTATLGEGHEAEECAVAREQGRVRELERQQDIEQEARRVWQSVFDGELLNLELNTVADT